METPNQELERMRKLNEELERRLSECAAELKATNTELEAFAYAVSHDLRGPLHTVGLAMMLLEGHEGQLDAEGKEYLQHIRNGAKRMADIIEALLGLSRITTSAMRREQVNLSRMAEEIAARLQAAQPGRRVAFVIRPDLMVTGDARLLGIVLENLIGNAWKFTGKREQARIEVGMVLQREVDAQEEPSSEAESPVSPVYFVRDDGVGFASSEAKKLFAPFKRLHPIAEFEGSGIGLATVQRIIRRHGGRTWAEGAEGKGATFYFTLP